MVMKSVFNHFSSYIAVLAAFVVLAGIGSLELRAETVCGAAAVEDNFGLPPKKIKENPTNKPEKAPKKPWALSQKQLEYANVGTAFNRKTMSSVDGKTYRGAYKGYKTGISLFSEGRRVEAIPYLLQAYEANPENLLLNVLLGHCYTVSVMTRFEAEPYLRKALALDSGNFESRYDLARLYVSRYELDSAIILFERCLQTPDLDTAAQTRCMRRIKECRYAKQQIKKPARVFVDNMGSTLNSPYPDYAPLVNADETQIYFTSLRPGAVTEDVDTYSGMSFEDVYLACKDSIVDTLWMVYNVGEPVNTAGHDASAGLSSDESTLFVYRGAKREGEIFTALSDASGWAKPKRLGEGKETGTPISQEQTISFTFDGKTAYFVSDREGGYGGFDIWMIRQEGEGWSEPVNLGPTINTPQDEISVFVISDGNSIFFSSNGHLTMGGYDIFYSQKGDTDTSWSEPQNLGWPINTVENDAFYRHSLTGKTGYYASERMAESMGGYDLYRVTYMGEEKGVITQSEDQLLAYITAPVSESVAESAAEIKITPITLLKGFVYDDYTKEPLAAEVVMVDNDLQQEIALFKSNPRTGRFMIQLPAGHNYAITVRRDGYLFHSENFDLPATAEYQEISKDFPLKNVSVGSRVVLRNIFYEFDKATLLPQSYVELDRLYKLLVEVPTIKIEISGHTDNKGSANYNQGLSERRAKSVVEYLVDRGISIDRLTYVGMGLTQPIASNDTEEGRALNRRTEFKIIENNMDAASGMGRRQHSHVNVESPVPAAADETPAATAEPVEPDPDAASENISEPASEPAPESTPEPASEQVSE